MRGRAYGLISTMLILNFLPSASTTKKVRRPRPKPKTTPHPEVPQTILGKYVVCDLFCVRGYPIYLFRVNSWFAKRTPHG